jgi:hypothetical protein
VSKRYVVYCHEHLRDGHEYGAKVVGSIEAALREMKQARQNFYGSPHNLELRLFELGPEIPVEEVVTEEPAPPKTSVEFKLK